MLKKFWVILIIFITLPLCANSEETVLRGSVAYTVESAKNLAFEGIDLKLDKKVIKPYIYDENNKENLEAIKNNTQPKGRYIMSFSLVRGFVKGYVVVYDDKPQYSYYYTNGGTLVCIDVDNKSQEEVFPYTIGKYSALTGNLAAIGFYVSEEEQYAYTKEGKLKAHWVGNTGYNEKGRPIAKRTVVNEIPDN